MKNRIILHIDMNSYFASVEQQANPLLRGRSVGVCSYLSPGGCIIASSREAKAKGIKTGCRVSEARVLDPAVILVENEPAKYRSVTEAIARVLHDYSDRIEPYSIDESFLDLSGWAPTFAFAEGIAREIQARIKSEAGEWLDSSVGISWTRWLAKFASDIAPKKEVLLIDTPEKLEAIVRGRPLEEAWGIGGRMAPRLMAMGISDLGALQAADADSLRRTLGRWGYYLWANLNGIEIAAVADGAPAPKNVGHSYCLPKKVRDKSYLARVLYKLCEKTGRRLRASEREAREVSVFFAYTYGGGTGRSWKTGEALFTTAEIYREAGGFLDGVELVLPVRMIAVSVGRLAPVSGQLSFFDDRLSRHELSRALDRINDKYGDYTVVPGAMWGTGEMARDRIGFRKL